MNNITVLLAEDHTVVREGFRMLLDAEDDLEVVGEAQTGRQAVELTKKLRPSVVVMDIAMPLAQWTRSHTANSQGRSEHQGGHSLRAQR
jgi:DNA-binding NarL/FixJ family response regulator